MLQRLDVLRAVPVFAGLDDYLQFLTFDFVPKTFSTGERGSFFLTP